MTYFRAFRRRRWRVAVRAYDLRECPWCMCLVAGDRGQRGHGAWHEDVEPGTEEEGEWAEDMEMAGESSQ